MLESCPVQLFETSGQSVTRFMQTWRVAVTTDDPIHAGKVCVTVATTVTESPTLAGTGLLKPNVYSKKSWHCTDKFVPIKNKQTNGHLYLDGTNISSHEWKLTLSLSLEVKENSDDRLGSPKFFRAVYMKLRYTSLFWQMSTIKT